MLDAAVLISRKHSPLYWFSRDKCRDGSCVGCCDDCDKVPGEIKESRLEKSLTLITLRDVMDTISEAIGDMNRESPYLVHSPQMEGAVKLAIRVAEAFDNEAIFSFEEIEED